MAWNVHRVFEESDGQLKSISDEHDRVKASLSTAQSYKWDEVLDPLTSAEERNSNLTELLGLPSSGEAKAHALLALGSYSFGARLACSACPNNKHVSSSLALQGSQKVFKENGDVNLSKDGGGTVMALSRCAQSVLIVYNLAVPAQPQEGLPRYASALLVSPSKGEDSFTDIRLDDPIYTTQPEGQPGTLAYRTFLQVTPTPQIR